MKFLVLMTLVFSTSSFGRTVARVLDVSGNAFVFSPTGESKELVYSSKVSDFSEVMVEDGAKLTFLTSQGHKVFVKGGSLVKLYHGIVELQSGSLWVKSKKGQGPGIVQTSNSVGRYGAGEFVVSFDNIKNKTQVLVLDGLVNFSNSVEPELGVNVEGGQFSFVATNYEGGAPRVPTKIGKESYASMKSKFSEFKDLSRNDWDSVFEKKKPVRKRMIASVNVHDQFSDVAPAPKAPAKKKGKVVFIRTYQKGRVPASVGSNPLDYYNGVQAEIKKSRMPIKTNKSATVRVFGLKKKAQVMKPSKAKSRVPASKAAKKVIKAQDIQYGDSELDMLLQDLNSYEQ